MSTTMTAEALSLDVLKAAHSEARAHVRETADARTAGGSTPAGALKKARAELAHVIAEDAVRSSGHALAVALDRDEIGSDIADTIESLEAAAARSEACRAELARLDSASVAVVHELANRLGEVARARQEQGLPSPRVRLAAGSWVVVLEALKAPPTPPTADGRIPMLQAQERDATLVLAKLDAARAKVEADQAEAQSLVDWNRRARAQEDAERIAKVNAAAQAQRAVEDALLAACGWSVE
jgi:hypothetical protein